MQRNKTVYTDIFVLFASKMNTGNQAIKKNNTGIVCMNRNGISFTGLAMHQNHCDAKIIRNNNNCN